MTRPDIRELRDAGVETTTIKTIRKKREGQRTKAKDRRLIITSWDCRECDSHAHIDHRMNPGRVHDPKRHAIETGHSKFELVLVTEEAAR